jgi:4-diphosphocytidyl-2-C-methyl-D-erythritol kinase
MNEIKLRANAKINLFLDVLDKRSDGYHNIETIFQSIDLHDVLTIQKSESINITCNNPKVPLDSTNLVYKAVDILLKDSKKDFGVNIHITKNIPIGGGLAGGSADASATLIGLNKLWDLGYSFDELLKFGVKLGSDVPFCMIGGTALGKGRGEDLRIIGKFPNAYIVLANPVIEISTAWAYKQLSNLGLTRNRKDGNILLEKIQQGDLTDIGSHFHNVFEQIVIQEYPIIEKIKTEMLKHNVLGAMMTGSGSTVFAITNDEKVANEVHSSIAEIVEYCIITKTSNFSISEI